MYIYYFKYDLDTTALAQFLDHAGFNRCIAGINSVLTGAGMSPLQWPQDAATSAFSAFSAGGILAMIAGIGFSRRLADRYGKRNVFGGALLISTLFLLAFYLYSPNAIGWVFASYMLHGLFYGITIPLLWAMIPDVADYSEWKNHRRATAIIFSAMLCGLKIGLSVGGALVAGILAFYGYDPALAQQNAAVTNGIRLAISVYASFPFLVGTALLAFYEIDKAMETRIEYELGLRRQAAPLATV